MSDKSGSFLAGLLFGATVGAVAGILLAPKSGKETREEIKKLAGDIKDKAQDTYSEAKESLNRKLVAIKSIGGKIDKTKYQALVQEVIEELKGDSKVTVEASKKLGNLLRNDWTKVEKAFKA